MEQEAPQQTPEALQEHSREAPEQQLPADGAPPAAAQLHMHAGAFCDDLHNAVGAAADSCNCCCRHRSSPPSQAASRACRPCSPLNPCRPCMSHYDTHYCPLVHARRWTTTVPMALTSWTGKAAWEAQGPASHAISYAEASSTLKACLPA